jgi:hypothetical protein
MAEGKTIKVAKGKRSGTRLAHLWSSERAFIYGYPLCGVRLPWRLADEAEASDRRCRVCAAIKARREAKRSLMYGSYDESASVEVS